MAYFKATSLEELKKEYRVLAKKYHPDLGGDTATMQAINAEYDKHYDEISSGNTQKFSFWNTAKDSREFIVFMVKTETGHLVGYTPSGYDFWGIHGYQTIIPDNCPNLHPGFAVMKRTMDSGLDIVKATGYNIQVDCPTIQELSATIPTDIAWWHIEDKEYAEINNQYGHFFVNLKEQKIVAKYNGDVFTMDYPRGKFPPVRNARATMSMLDVHFLAYQDCTYDEFTRYHDVNYRHQFHDAMSMRPAKNFVSQSPAVAYLVKKKAITIYESSMDFRCRYGTFNAKALIPILKNISIDDVEEAQDYLDKINSEFDEKVKNKIKKGKLKVVI